MTAKRSCSFPSPIEEIYDFAYKSATAIGEKDRGAHIRGLEAVYNWALVSAKSRPVRMTLYRGITWLHRRLRPWDGGPK